MPRPNPSLWISLRRDGCQALGRCKGAPVKCQRDLAHPGRHEGWATGRDGGLLRVRWK